MFKIAATSIAAALVALAATIVYAHEDREHGDYKLVVGFLHEPAYEGERNAVSVRVTRQAEADSHAHAMGEPIESGVRVGVSLSAQADERGGVDLRIDTEGWRWAPESVDQAHAPGSGHAHVYVDGEKVGRSYGPHHHLSGVEPGERVVRVTLESNTHRTLMVDGALVESTAKVVVPDAARADGDHMNHDHEHTKSVAAESPMSLEAAVRPDASGGFDLHLSPSGFEFAPRNVGAEHAAGEGYALVSVDGEPLTRQYVEWLRLPTLDAGMREIEVSLMSNDHRAYMWNGSPVSASATVHAMGGGDSHDEAHHAEARPTHVEGLQDTLKVEVEHVPSGVSRVMDLRAASNDPGHYTADLIPTSPGHYRFRLFGSIEDTEIDATFDSRAGGGDFDDVSPATAIHFPQEMASARELESAVRGAQETARQAQDASDSGAALGAIGIAAGLLGAALGGAALAMSIRGRRAR